VGIQPVRAPLAEDVEDEKSIAVTFPPLQLTPDHGAVVLQRLFGIPEAMQDHPDKIFFWI